MEEVLAKYDYKAENTSELSMTKNEALTLLDDSKTWWKVRNKSNQTGYVPSNYISRKKKLPFGFNNKPKELKSETSQERRVVARYNYEKQRDDELELVKGNRVVVLEESEDKWWRGRNLETGEDGWFPSNYVTDNVEQPITDNNSAPSGENELSILQNYNHNSPILENVRCLYPFAGQNESELPFQENEELEILGKPADDPEWWVARNHNGKIGLVPRIYTEVIEQTYPVQEERTISQPETYPAVQSRYPEIADREWFHESISSRGMAESKLMPATEGEFLVRPSESAKVAGNFSVSVKGRTKVKHFRVSLIDKQYQIGQRKFESLDKMIENYKRNPIFSEADERLFLTRALQR